MTVHYDDLDINRDIRLDLPFREGVGIITQDVAKPHHPVTLHNTPAWTTLDSHLQVLTLDGVNEHLRSLQANTVDLNFTSNDYSLGGWFFIASGGSDDKTLMSRFLVSTNGWELYHYPTNHSITLRHHHAAGATARTGAYCLNWVFNKWWFIGISRHAGAAQFWRGDIDGFAAIPTICSVGGLIDPEPCTQNLYIGSNTGGATNFFKGMVWRPRIWGDRYLSEADWGQTWEREVRWFRS